MKTILLEMFLIKQEGVKLEAQSKAYFQQYFMIIRFVN